MQLLPCIPAAKHANCSDDNSNNHNNQNAFQLMMGWIRAAKHAIAEMMKKDENRGRVRLWKRKDKQ